MVVKTPAGIEQVLVRKFQALTDLEQIRFWLEIVAELFKNGVPVGAPRQTKTGELFVSYNDGRYVLFDFIEGQHFLRVCQV